MLVGPIGFDNVGGMDYDDQSGVLYGVGNVISNGQQVLLTINPTTGAGTEIGPTGLGDQNIHGDIAFRNGNEALYGYDSGNVYTYNLTTGAATLLGNSGDGFPEGNALAFSAANTLYKADQNSLWTVNQTTGVDTVFTNLDYPSQFVNSRAAAMKFDFSTGVLYATCTTGSGGTNYLATINVNSGTVTEIGGTAFGLDSIAIIQSAVPEPSVTALVGMGFLGLLALNRRKS